MKIDIGIYYGPIDLLVYLVRKKEVDIFDIPIAQIAEEYLDYIRKIEREDLEDAADFLLMAAILIRLKVRSLLPRTPVDEEEVKPITLMQIVGEYKKYKEIAKAFSIMEAESSKQFPRISKEEPPLEQGDVASLILAFRKLKPQEEEKLIVKRQEIPIEIIILKNGTKISLLVRSHRPDKRYFVIERSVPNPPVVKNQDGNLLPLTPLDILAHVEVFGQHEISDLTKSPEKLTRLLDRFMEPDVGLVKRKSELHRGLERSRLRILDVRKEIKQIEERLAALPSLEETLKRYQDAKLEERLKDQSLLVREERILKTADERIKPFKDILNDIHSILPIDIAFVSEKALQDLPGREILHPLHNTLQEFNEGVGNVVKDLELLIRSTEDHIKKIHSKWGERKESVQVAYEKILRELQKSRVNGEEFLRLRRQIEELKPLKERKTSLLRNEEEYIHHRRNLLDEWEDAKRKEFQRLERAAKKVSRQLANRVRIQVAFAGNSEPLFNLLREQIEGRFKEALDVLRKKTDLSLVALAEACRVGKDELSRKFSIPSAQADRLGQAGESTFMQIEELDLPSTVRIELNVAAEGQSPDWKSLDDLSKGQKATAVLLLLLLESDVPLVVDQPEDDLDNRFITEGIVPKMREEKWRRQFIFATHNANIPVLGDAELIVGLNAVGEAGMGRAEMPSEHMGSIDSQSVRELVEEILEGGKAAFETRRLKYGF